MHGLHVFSHSRQVTWRSGKLSTPLLTRSLRFRLPRRTNRASAPLCTTPHPQQITSASPRKTFSRSSSCTCVSTCTPTSNASSRPSPGNPAARSLIPPDKRFTFQHSWILVSSESMRHLPFLAMGLDAPHALSLFSDVNETLRYQFIRPAAPRTPSDAIPFVGPDLA